ncbi:siderophore-interacting protein [Agromyces soli]|uniref:Siderophore-interacting protein n=1 Tax=Agromyces soli TaxID=659012 RepID=A0ABY4AW34_9MICO|nr:siderophore-interacting protein [Agromyces soli]UOE25065.1 siderophore-interacting protein [Agromyces soli]
MTAIAAGPWEYRAFPVTVHRTERLSPGFVRVTLAGSALGEFAPWGLDQRIKLVLPAPDGSRLDFGLLGDPTPHPKEWYARWKALPEESRNVLRTYTPAAVRPEQGEIDVDLFIHQPAGPASAWALACRPGDELVVTGPDARAGYTGYGIHYTPPSPPQRLVLIGDESALPAMRNILAAQPADVTVDLILELGDVADDLLSATSSTARVQLVSPDARRGAALERAVVEWAEHASATASGHSGVYAWVAGEAGATTRIRRYLTSTAGLDKGCVAFLGYWTIGGPLVG